MSMFVHLFLNANSKSFVAAGSATSCKALSMQSRRENGATCRSIAPCSIFEKSRIPSMIWSVKTAELRIVSTYSRCCSDNGVSSKNMEQDRSALNGVPKKNQYLLLECFVEWGAYVFHATYLPRNLTSQL